MTLSSSPSCSPKRVLLAAATGLVLALSAATTTHAQTTTPAFTPVTVWGAVSVFQEGKSMIVIAGSDGARTSPQTFSVDLSVPWKTDSPVFKTLTAGPSDYKHSGALLNTNNNVFLISNRTGYSYDINLDSWRNLGGSVNLNNVRGMGMATNPDTGYIYVPNGYSINGTGPVQMLQYDLVGNQLKGLPMHPPLLNMASFSLAWNTVLKGMLVYGGAASGTNNVVGTLYSWSPITGWKELTVTGDIPTPRRSACFVSAYNGTKMVLYGGLTDQSNSVTSDVYLLDVATLAWKKGTDAGAVNARAESACAVTNDFFISWGGGGVQSVITANYMIVYNMKTDKWVTDYTPVPSPPTPSGGPNNGGNGGSGGAAGKEEGGSSKGAIIGGVVGGIVVIAAILGFLFYRRKQGKKTVQEVRPQGQDLNKPLMQAAPVLSPAPTQYQQQPWEQQQHQQPLQMQHIQHQPQPVQTPVQPQIFSPQQPAYSQPYAPYQPPIVHDYQIPQQQVNPAQIYQPQHSPMSPTTPTSGPSTQAYSEYDSSSYHHQSPSISGATGATPLTTGTLGSVTPVHQHYPLPPTTNSIYGAPVPVPAIPGQHEQQVGVSPPSSSSGGEFSRPPQNPQAFNVPDSYAGDDQRR